MRLLVPLLVMGGVLAVATGFLQMVLRQDDACAQEFQCDNLASVESALAGAAFFSIAVMLWGIAGTLVWMRKKFDDLPF